ncbi:hypothetical protein [uncultured Methylobacterium sp.]|uniref:hypothetical protein n=1 Tax=uncultured Methylobacterium sp. TaxID=157278 RepID=UPI0035C992B5
MVAADSFDAMAELCLVTHEAVQCHGSREMKLLTNLLLHVLAEEIVRRTEHDPNSNTDDEA